MHDSRDFSCNPIKPIQFEMKLKIRSYKRQRGKLISNCIKCRLITEANLFYIHPICTKVTTLFLLSFVTDS